MEQRRNLIRRVPMALAALATILALAGATSGTARGTFKGANGKVAFTQGFVGVFVTTPTGTDPRLAVKGGFAPAWSPDGRRLAAARRLPGPCAPCSFAIDVVSFPEGGEKRIFEGTTFDPAPAWSPDGRRIAFTHQRLGQGDDEIWVMDADGGSATQITSTLDNFHPVWSPDGETIAFDGFDETGVHLYTVRADGSDLRQLTFGRTFDIRPNWSPDGSKIAFVSNREGSFEIYVANADGSGLRRLTSGSQQTGARFPYFNPSWSPDGRQIVFGYDRGAGPLLFLMDADGGNQQQIRGVLPAAEDPDWQPTVDVSVSLIGPRRVAVGQRIQVRAVLRNASPRAATSVTLIDLVPRQAVPISASASQGRCRIGRRVDCMLGELASGSGALIRIVLRARQAGRATNVVTVRAAEADPREANNRSTLRTVVARNR